MKQPRCYVISHDSSRVIDECLQSLKQHGWQFEKFPAVNGWTVSEKDWERIGVQISQDGKLKIRPGAQGCWLSHFALWQKCEQSNEPIVIMEHDCVVTDSWPENLDISKQLIKLYRTAECKINPTFGRWSKGSHAYTLTPDQARTLIDHARVNCAQAVDKHLGDQVLPWTFYNRDLVVLNPRRGPSITSAKKQLL